MAYFYLGTHRPRWLETAHVPLFISHRQLAKYKCRGELFPKGFTSWALDSGGFTELSKYGEWRLDPDDFGGSVYRFMEDVGTPPDFVAIQDWMCEPKIRAKTGLTVAEHQLYTIDSLIYLRREFPHVPWIPVLQGWHLQDYLDHVEQYAAAGVDLAAEPLVGLGSVCRRQSTREIGAIVTVLHALGLKLHGFGVKAAGLAKYGHLLKSADSMAWSFIARIERIRLAGCDHKALTCQNCMRFAMRWRDKVLQGATGSPQHGLALDFGTHTGGPRSGAHTEYSR